MSDVILEPIPCNMKLPANDDWSHDQIKVV